MNVLLQMLWNVLLKPQDKIKTYQKSWSTIIGWLYYLNFVECCQVKIKWGYKKLSFYIIGYKNILIHSKVTTGET